MWIARVCLLAFGAACGSQVEGKELGATYADLSELADELTLDALECAHDSGVEEAYLSDGGIVGEANVVSDCFARLLEHQGTQRSPTTRHRWHAAPTTD